MLNITPTTPTNYNYNNTNFTAKACCDKIYSEMTNPSVVQKKYHYSKWLVRTADKIDAIYYKMQYRPDEIWQDKPSLKKFLSVCSL